MAFIAQNKWRIYCTTEGTWTSGWSATKPTTCFNNAGHSVNGSSQTVIEDGNLKTTNIFVNGADEVCGISNLCLEGYMQFNDTAEPADSGAGTGIVFKKTGLDGLFWKPDTGTQARDIGSPFGQELQHWYFPEIYSTTSSTLMHAMTTTTTSLEGGTYYFAWSMSWKTDASSDMQILIKLDDITDLKLLAERAPAGGLSQNISFGGFRVLALSSGTHLIEVYFSVANNKTIQICETDMILFRLE